MAYRRRYRSRYRPVRRRVYRGRMIRRPRRPRIRIGYRM